MPKSPAQQVIRLGGHVPTHTLDTGDTAWCAWQAHVDCGNIGSGPGTTAEQMARHAHNESVLCRPRVPRIWED